MKRNLSCYFADGQNTDLILLDFGKALTNKNQKWDPLRAMKTFIRKEDGSYYVVSANNAS